MKQHSLDPQLQWTIMLGIVAVGSLLIWALGGEWGWMFAIANFIGHLLLLAGFLCLLKSEAPKRLSLTQKRRQPE